MPPIALAFVFLAASLWQMRIVRQRPMRMDNSLFLRAGLRMREVPLPDASAANPPVRLEKSDLMRFGRFLGVNICSNSDSVLRESQRNA